MQRELRSAWAFEQGGEGGLGGGGSTPQEWLIFSGMLPITGF